MPEIHTICTAIQSQVLESGRTLDSKYEETLLFNIKKLTSLMQRNAIQASERRQLLELCQAIKCFQDNNLLLKDPAKCTIKDFALQLQKVRIKEENNMPSAMKFVQLGNKLVPYQYALNKFVHPLRQKIVEFGISEYDNPAYYIIELKKQEQNGVWGSDMEQLLAARG